MNILTQTISREQIKRYLESVLAAIEVPPARANWGVAELGYDEVVVRVPKNNTH